MAADELAAPLERRSASGPAGDAGLGALEAMVRRLLRVTRVLLGIHVDTAKKEAKADATRLAMGVGMLATGVFLFAVTFVLLETAAVMLLHTYAYVPWPWAVLEIAGGNAFVGVVLLWVGKGRLQGPVLGETRSLLSKTVAALRDEAG